MPCLEITVTEKLYVNLAVRTFTSERLKKKISFTKRKFEDYPKYIFSANNTLRRRLKGEEETCFILRQEIKLFRMRLFLENPRKYKVHYLDWEELPN